MRNVDAAEVEKFERLAADWWDKNGSSKPLHDMNPLRLQYITQTTGDLSGLRVLDVGCGGGILSESLAQAGAKVTAIDMAQNAIDVAKLHQGDLDIDYHCTTVEDFVATNPAPFDVITCMEMLEHVPDPQSIINECAKRLKPQGHLFLSTINRNKKAYALAIIGAEYVLNLLPRGTHDYDKFIQPAELAAMLRQAQIKLTDIAGMTYNPLSQTFALGEDVDVNYLMTAQHDT